MEADNLITGALGDAGHMIGGQALFILEGHPDFKEFRILPADDVFENNIVAFAYGISTGYTFLGMYTTREAAAQSAETIKTLLKNSDGISQL